jgi:hypothetical protein
MTLRFY